MKKLKQDFIMGKRRRIYIYLIGICVPCLIFILDDFFRREYEDPFRVAKAFSYSYMTKDTEHMKSWAYKEAYEKIDDLQYSTPVSVAEHLGHRDDFELVCFRRLGYTIVSTYAQTIVVGEELPLFYSAVLEPVGSDSIWERVTDFIYFKVPLGSKICSFPRSKDRWLVVDFFTNDDYEKYTTALLGTKNNEAVDWFFSVPSTEEIGQRQNYEEMWGDAEKIRQNEEMKILYKNYIELQNKVSEENLPVKDEEKK